MTAVVLATVLAAAAAWILTPRWSEERTGRLHGVKTDGMPARGLALLQGLAARWRVGQASRRRQARRRVAVIHALSALAADLQAGQPPLAALIEAGGSPSSWPAAAGAARLGDDVAGGLMVDGARDPVLLQLAACWQVAIDSGSGLATSVAQLAASARSAEDVRVQLEAELAGPRATARTLALLPLVGVAFGVMLGADPLGWLLGSSVGRGCLVVGGALTALGAWWTGRIAANVQAML
jgi:tight adherence protein B